MLRAKSAGAWNLHELTEKFNLDYFLLFSSAVSVLGGAGEGVYAAANAFLDALAHLRRQRELPALSVSWGPWEVGMASRAREYLAEVGLSTLSVEQGLAALGNLVGSARAHAVVADANWFRIATRYGGVASSLATNLSSASHLSPPRSRRRLDLQPMQLVKMCVRETLGLSGDYVFDPRQPLRDLGLDSITAIELRELLEHHCGCHLPATLAYEYPTVIQLTRFIEAQVSGDAQALERQVDAGSPQANGPDELDRSALESLSDDELDSLLRRELAELRQEL